MIGSDPDADDAFDNPITGSRAVLYGLASN
jgi:hypothetical protein